MPNSNKSKLSLLIDENERIERIASGDGRAFRDLVGQYYNLAYSLAYKILNDASDAEEIVQDAFVKIHKALDTFRGDASLKTWIMRIVMRLSLNRRRDRSRSSWRRLGLHRGEDVEIPAPAAQTPEAQYIAGETRAQVRRLVDQLHDSLRQVLILNSFDDLSYDEIAQILGVPIGTVSSRLHSARKKLLRQLKERDLL